MPRIEDAGDFCLRKPRPTQGCRADDDDGDGVLYSIQYIILNTYRRWLEPTKSEMLHYLFHPY